jgi:hypothetical protein
VEELTEIVVNEYRRAREATQDAAKKAAAAQREAEERRTEREG